VVGQVGFRSLYLRDGLAELSYWTAQAHRRHHNSSQATQLLAEWAFDVLGLERLEIVHSVANPASCSVALRAGFRIEGVKRHLQRHADGFHDMCLHSRIREDDGRPIVPAPAPAPAPDELEVRGRGQRLRALSRSVLRRPEKVVGAGMATGS
jgi:hypothetical protein